MPHALIKKNRYSLFPWVQLTMRLHCLCNGLVPHSLGAKPLTLSGRDKMADILQTTFSNAFFEWKCSFRNWLKFVPNIRISNIPALVQIMAWRRPGAKPLSDPMMISLLTHICVTRPQWMNGLKQCWSSPLMHIYVTRPRSISPARCRSSNLKKCLLHRLFMHRSKKTSKLRVTGLCEGNSPVTGESPHKGPVTRKVFPFDDVITNSTA